MMILNSDIIIGKYRFKWVSEVTIRKSYETYTNTATITMPNQLRTKNQYILDEFNEGDEVEIRLGYKPNLTTVFVGYLARKVSGNPAIFECEDESWKLKKVGLAEYSKVGITLDTLLKDNYTGAYECEDAIIGDFQIAEGSTLLQVFDELKNFGFFSYFENGVLKVKNKSSIINEVTHELSFQKNICEGSELKFIKADDISVVSYVESKQSDGTVLKSYAYYEGNVIKNTTSKPVGTLNTFSTPGNNQDTIDKLAVRRLPNLYHTGSIGSITTFGSPIIEIGDKVKITDERFSDKNGTYAVKNIDINFGMNGYRQTLEIDTKL